MNTITQCPCGSQIAYETCCGLYIDQNQLPTTPERLMRSRYCAYTQAKTDYIKKTMRGKALEGFNEQEAATWAKEINWLGLQIVKSYLDTNNENIGYVEFIANYEENDTKQTLHELSQFQRVDEQWYYTSGVLFKQKKATSKEKISRNALCPCGSQRKYKNCHGVK